MDFIKFFRSSYANNLVERKIKNFTCSPLMNLRSFNETVILIILANLVRSGLIIKMSLLVYASIPYCKAG